MSKPSVTAEKSHLPRLPLVAYRGFVIIHWTYAIKDRKNGWLDTLIHAAIREHLLHTCFRYQLACPVYCLMPDHIHLLLAGTSSQSDQQKATKFLRRHLKGHLAARNAEFQRQPYDHILREKERSTDAFGSLLHYILENPVRANLVEKKTDWPHLGAIIPGYPDIEPCAENYAERYWKLVKQIIER